MKYLLPFSCQTIKEIRIEKTTAISQLAKAVINVIIIFCYDKNVLKVQ